MVRDLSWDINGMISYGATTNMGLGIFARRNIIERTEILCDPVRTFDKHDAKLLRQTDAYRMMFVDREKFGSSTVNPPIHLVLGPIAMLNHGNEENCFVSWELDNERPEKSRARLFAKRDIKAGEQLLMRYHNAEEYEFA